MAEDQKRDGAGQGLSGLDPKAAKAKLKADRKQFKKEQKELEKERRSREKALADAEEELNADDSAGISTFLITGMIILMWIIIMGLLIKLDVGGFGSTVLSPLLKDVPYLNKILPEGEREESSFSDASGVESSQVSEEYLKQMETQLADAQTKTSSQKEEIARLEAEVARLEPFEAQQAALEEERKRFYDEVLYAEEAPDASAYASYYEMIDPEAAAELYQKVVAEDSTDEEVNAYAKTFSTMKAKAAAAILSDTNMDMNLAARILNMMTAEERGKILAAMTDTSVAAELTKLLRPSGLPGVNGVATAQAGTTTSTSSSTGGNRSGTASKNIASSLVSSSSPTSSNTSSGSSSQTTSSTVSSSSTGATAAGVSSSGTSSAGGSSAGAGTATSSGAASASDSSSSSSGTDRSSQIVPGQWSNGQ